MTCRGEFAASMALTLRHFGLERDLDGMAPESRDSGYRCAIPE
jgi:hypothetical protein